MEMRKYQMKDHISGKKRGSTVLGEGELDIAKVIETGLTAGVSWMVVEREFVGESKDDSDYRTSDLECVKKVPPRLDTTLESFNADDVPMIKVLIPTVFRGSGEKRSIICSASVPIFKNSNILQFGITSSTSSRW